MDQIFVVSMLTEKNIDPKIRRGLFINIIAGSLGMAFIAIAIGNPATMFLEFLQCSGTIIGGFVVVNQLTMMLQIPGALFAERLEYRKTYWAICAILHRGIWFLPGLLPLLLDKNKGQIIGIAFLILTGISGTLANLSAASWFSWMSDLVPANISGRFWGIRQVCTTLAFLISTLISGWILDYWKIHFPNHIWEGFALIFGIAALLGVLDIIIHLEVPEPAQKRDTINQPFTQRISSIFSHAEFWKVTGMMGAFFFAIALVGSFTLVYLKQTHHAQYIHLSILTLSANLSAMLMSYGIGSLIDRFGVRLIVSLLFGIIPCFSLTWFLIAPSVVTFQIFHTSITVPQPIVLFTLLNLLAGGCYAGVNLCHMELIRSRIPAENRTLALAFHWSITSIPAALGGWIGGAIMDHFLHWNSEYILPMGEPFSYIHLLILLHMGVIWLVCLPIARTLQPYSRDQEITDVLYRLVIWNPLRVINNAYYIFILNQSRSPDTIQHAMDKIVTHRHKKGIKNIIRKLSDTYPEMRKTAIHALGKFLQFTPYPVSSSPSISSSASSKTHQEVLTALMQHLTTETNPDTIREGIQILSEIKDPNIIPTLLNLIAKQPDSHLIQLVQQTLHQFPRNEVLPHLVHNFIHTANSSTGYTFFILLVSYLLPPNNPILLTLQQESLSLPNDPIVAKYLRSIAQQIHIISSSLPNNETSRQIQETWANILHIHSTGHPDLSIFQYLSDLILLLQNWQKDIQFQVKKVTDFSLVDKNDLDPYIKVIRKFCEAMQHQTTPPLLFYYQAVFVSLLLIHESLPKESTISTPTPI